MDSATGGQRGLDAGGRALWHIPKALAGFELLTGADRAHRECTRPLRCAGERELPVTRESTVATARFTVLRADDRQLARSPVLDFLMSLPSAVQSWPNGA
ncbi:MAG: hypothetical protein ACRDQ5_22890 [Sciscionella sp.]